MSVIDYIGRKYDMLAFQGADAGKQGVSQRLRTVLAEEDNSGLIVAGIQKLAQQFLLILLTDVGSLQYLPTMGCRLLTDARQGRWRTPLDVQQSFFSALVDVKSQLLLLAAPTDPTDEQYSNADLKNLIMTREAVAFDIELSSVAGTSYRFIQPIPIIVK